MSRILGSWRSVRKASDVVCTRLSSGSRPSPPSPNTEPIDPRMNSSLSRRNFPIGPAVCRDEDRATASSVEIWLAPRNWARLQRRRAEDEPAGSKAARRPVTGEGSGARPCARWGNTPGRRQPLGRWARSRPTNALRGAAVRVPSVRSRAGSRWPGCLTAPEHRRHDGLLPQAGALGLRATFPSLLQVPLPRHQGDAPAWHRAVRGETTSPVVVTLPQSTAARAPRRFFGPARAAPMHLETCSSRGGYNVTGGWSRNRS